MFSHMSFQANVCIDGRKEHFRQFSTGEINEIEWIISLQTEIGLFQS